MPNFKKIVSAICAAAMIATTTVIPAMAAKTEVLNVDYTAADADTSAWTLGANTTVSADSENGLTLDKTSKDNTASSSMSLDTEITTSALIEYEVQMYCNGDGTNTLSIGPNSGSSIVQFKLNKYAATGSLNGNELSSLPTSSRTSNNRWSAWYTVKHLVNMSKKTVTTTLVSGGTEYYNRTDEFVTAEANAIAYIGVSLAKYNAVSFKNLKISTIELPTIETEDIKRIIPGETLNVATVSNAVSKSVSVSDTENFTCAVDEETGVVSVTALNSVEDGKQVTVTVTATADVTDSVSITLTAGKEQYFANALANTVDILTGNTNLTASGTEFKATGNFTLPVENDGATISWASSDSSLISLNEANAVVYPKSASKVTLTATVDYNGATAHKDFVVDLTDYNALALSVVAAEIANKTVKYAADTKGDIYSLTLADGAIVENDLLLPSVASVTVDSNRYTVNVAWSVADNNYLTSEGVISVEDKNKHTVALTKTVSYLMNGTVVATDSVTYNVDVQFVPDTLKQTITDLVNTKNSGITEESAKFNLDTYLRAFVYNYQVKFDTALASNFDSVPTSINTAGILGTTLPLTGAFGSQFVWESSDSSILNVTPSTGAIVVSLPSSAKNVSLTAKVQSGTAETQVKTVSVAVSGTGIGGGNSNYGGNTRPSVSGSIAGGNVTPVTPSNPSTNVTNPNPSGFTDLDSVQWAVTAINNLYVNNIIEGKTATEFYPNDNITRAEFATILVKAFNIPLVSVDSPTFYDVPTSHWASKYIETAAAMGIVEGYDDGSFEPNTNVTRQDMAIMVKRAAEATGYTFAEKVEATTFTDEATIAAYAKSAVLELQKAGVVNGVEGGAYAPLATSTRAQACQIIYNVFNK